MIHSRQEQVYFYAGFLLKLILSAFLLSESLQVLFVPFIDYYIGSGFENPYAYFLDKNGTEFPYPALMLYIMTASKLLFNFLHLSHIPQMSLMAYHLPLLIADTLIFFILKSWLKKRHLKLILFYWFSPVLLYISYIYGQLDAVPIALLFVGLYFLFKERFLLTALFLGLAMATKTHVAIIMPFFMLYLLSKDIGIKKLALCIIVFSVAFLTPNLPYMFDPSFLKMVFQNSEQNKIFNFSFTLGDLSFYLIPASLLLLFVKGVLVRGYNRDIFIMFLGFSFGIILLLIPPMQGWYFWLIPFFSYFFVKEEGRSPLLFLGLQIAYILYFISLNHVEYFDLLNVLNINSAKIINLNFTILQTILFANCLWVYKKGLESYSKHKIVSSPYLIGIGGDSGVGKTTVSNSISQIFTPKLTAVLRGDDMHKWQRGHEKWEEFTHLNPKANYLHKEIDVLQKLKSGRKIYRSHYDHNTGTFTSKKILKSNNLIIFEGLHPFYIAEQRKLFDFKIFIKPEMQLVHHWKIIRDSKKRGYSKEKILESIQKRESDSKKYIEKQSRYADILIEPMATKKIKNIGDEGEKVETYLRVYISNSIYLEPFLDKFSAISTLNLSHSYLDDDRQFLEIKGDVSTEKLNAFTDELIPGLHEIGIDHATLPKDGYGVLILLLTYYIFKDADRAR